MKTTKRFEEAVTKLYNAFHKGELNAIDCKRCAVGNIVGSGEWALSPTFAECNETKYPYMPNYLNTGYSALELRHIEWIFMFGNHIGGKIYGNFFNITNSQDTESQFKGLCAVVEYLCELDGIPNIMDYTALFESENNEPKKQLQEVFQILTK